MHPALPAVPYHQQHAGAFNRQVARQAFIHSALPPLRHPATWVNRLPPGQGQDFTFLLKPCCFQQNLCGGVSFVWPCSTLFIYTFKQLGDVGCSSMGV